MIIDTADVSSLIIKFYIREIMQPDLSIPYFSDPPAMFVRTTVSADTITLETADHQLLGINNKGQILLVCLYNNSFFHNYCDNYWEGTTSNSLVLT